MSDPKKIKVHEMSFEQRSRCFLNDLEYLCKFYSVQVRGDNCYQCAGPVVEDFLTGDEAKNLNWSGADVTVDLYGRTIHPAAPGSLTLIDDDTYHSADMEGEIQDYLRLMREAAHENG